MAADLEARIAELAAEWETLAGPITQADLRTRTAADPTGAPVDELLDPFGTPPRRPRWWSLAGAGLVAAGVIVGLVVVLSRSDTSDPAQPSDTVPPTVEVTVAPTPVVTTTPTPETSAAETAVPGPTTEPTATSDPATTTAPTLSDEESAARLDEIRAEVTQQLAGFDSFRAVATTTQRSTPAPDDTSEEPYDQTTTNTIILRADGSMWAEGETGWNAYDATTGIARTSWTMEDGSPAYQEVVGWAENTVPLNIAAGYDPTQLGVGGPGVAIREITSHLGRAAWEISWSFPFGGAPGRDTGVSASVNEESITVDRTTGLVIERTSRSVRDDGSESFEDARLDDLELGVELPAAWPGSFPDGATVDRSGDPNGFAALTIEQAAALFGPGLAVPTDRDVGSVSVGQINTGIGSTDLTTITQEVTITARTGFARSSIIFGRLLPIEGTPPPEGVASVDGSWCYSNDGATCTPSFGDLVIDAGALAGAQASMNGGYLVTQIGAVSVRVTGGSDDDAWALVRSLVAI